MRYTEYDLSKPYYLLDPFLSWTARGVLTFLNSSFIPGDIIRHHEMAEALNLIKQDKLRDGLDDGIKELKNHGYIFESSDDFSQIFMIFLYAQESKKPLFESIEANEAQNGVVKKKDSEKFIRKASAKVLKKEVQKKKNSSLIEV